MIVTLTTYEGGKETCKQIMDLAPFHPFYDDLAGGMSLLQREPETGRTFVWQEGDKLAS